MLEVNLNRKRLLLPNIIYKLIQDNDHHLLYLTVSKLIIQNRTISAKIQGWNRLHGGKAEKGLAGRGANARC